MSKTEKKPRGLDETAYELKDGQTYVPLVTQENVAEATLKAIVCGILLGILVPPTLTWV